MQIFKHYSLILFLCLLSCGRPLPTMEGIDLNQWKNDKNGCGNKRAGMKEALQTQKNKLQGLSEMQIIDLLGRPDQNELYSRNQKFYVYFLDPGKPCGQPVSASNLSIRFNATGLAKEVVVE